MCLPPPHLGLGQRLTLELFCLEQDPTFEISSPLSVLLCMTGADWTSHTAHSSADGLAHHLCTLPVLQSPCFVGLELLHMQLQLFQQPSLCFAHSCRPRDFLHMECTSVMRAVTAASCTCSAASARTPSVSVIGCSTLLES
jgi:hypothetical protein